MNFTCLDCGTEFQIDDDAAKPGATVKCSECGHPHVVPEAAAPLPDALVELLQSSENAVQETEAGLDEGDQTFSGEGVSGGSASKFQRPLRAFSSHRKKSVTTNMRPETPDAMTKMDAIREIAEDSKVEIPGKDFPPAPEGSGMGPWIVESPTGLVLEFPSSNLLVGWAAVVDNTAPYMVSRPEEDSLSLDEFVREIKRGKRPTQAISKSGAKSDGAQRPDEKSSPDLKQGNADKSGVSGDSLERGVMNPSQFQFKIQNSAPPSWRKWVIALAVAIGIAAAVGGAAFVYIVLLKQ